MTDNKGVEDDEADAVLDGYLELWKKTIDVQQHFNEIQWKIRGLALTAVTFTLGAAALAARDATTVDLHFSLFGWHFTEPLPRMIIFAGLVLWLMFGFVDGLWYHQFLKGAVYHGSDLEDELREAGLPKAGLSKRITFASQVTLLQRKANRPNFEDTRSKDKPDLNVRLRTLNSTRRLKFFYFGVAVLLLLIGLGLGDVKGKGEKGKGKARGGKPPASSTPNPRPSAASPTPSVAPSS
jgi:hypothetical protein